MRQDIGEDELVNVAVESVRAQEHDRLVNTADERAQSPGDLSTHQGEGRDPDEEDGPGRPSERAHPPPEHGHAGKAAAAHERRVQQVEQVVRGARLLRGRGRTERVEEGDRRERRQEKAAGRQGQEGQHGHLPHLQRKAQQGGAGPTEWHGEHRGQEQDERELEGNIEGEPRSVPHPKDRAVGRGRKDHQEAQGEPAAEEGAAGGHLVEEVARSMQQVFRGITYHVVPWRYTDPRWRASPFV